MTASRELAAALRYADFGWAVFPLMPGTKRPGTKQGCLDASCDCKTVRRWWQCSPRSGIGCATGPASGIVTIDRDGAKGFWSWADWLEELGLTRIEASTLVLETGREDIGRQMFYWYPDGDIRSRVRLRVGLDVRGHGGYTILPPTLHPSGRRYRWREPGFPALLPSVMAFALRRSECSEPSVPFVPRNVPLSGMSNYGRAALDIEVEFVRALAEGERAVRTFHHASNVGALVAGGEIDGDEARNELVAAALATGLGQSEAVRQTERGLAIGGQQPRRAAERERWRPPVHRNDDAPPWV